MGPVHYALGGGNPTGFGGKGAGPEPSLHLPRRLIHRGSPTSGLSRDCHSPGPGAPKPSSKFELLGTQFMILLGLHMVKVRARVPWAPCRELVAPDWDGCTGRGNKAGEIKTHLHRPCPEGSYGLARNLNLGLSPSSICSLISQTPSAGPLSGLGAPGCMG